MGECRMQRKPPRTRNDEASLFPQFALLPAELQLQIWEIAAAQPRILEAKPPSDAKYNRWTMRDQNKVALRFHVAHSPLMSTCRDSRNAFKRSPQFRREKGGLGSTHIGLKGIAWQPRIDTIYLDLATLGVLEQLAKYRDQEVRPDGSIRVKGRSQVRHVAMEWCPESKSRWMFMHKLFPRMESLVLFVPARAKSLSEEQGLLAKAGNSSSRRHHLETMDVSPAYVLKHQIQFRYDDNGSKRWDEYISTWEEFSKDLDWDGWNPGTPRRQAD